MKLSTSQFILEEISKNLFKVCRKHYGHNLATDYGEVFLSDEAIAGLEKKPHSGFWSEVVRQCVEQQGKLYDKYGK